MSEKHISAELRRLVTDRGQHCCEYCRTQARYSADSLPVDHITPRSLGGSTTPENLALVPDPVTEALVSLFHPRQQRWDAHFAWNDDFTLILGLTPTGRATIVALQLNRPGLVNLRRVLYAIGEHPPTLNSGKS